MIETRLEPTELEELAYSGREPEGFVRMRTPEGIVVTGFNWSSNPLRRLSETGPINRRLTPRQRKAGHRYERDCLVMNASQSNTATVIRLLQDNYEMDRAESRQYAEDRAFGRLMRKASECRSFLDLAPMKIDCARRLARIESKMSRVGYSLIEKILRYEMGNIEICQSLNVDAKYVTERTREAFEELASAYAAIDLEDQALADKDEDFVKTC